jgi:plasmid stabilization system protein ParE
VSLRVGTTPDADSQIREIDDWWRTNRRSSPDLFLQELTASFDIIGDAPYIGRPYRQSPDQVLAGSCSRELAITCNTSLAPTK